MVVLFGCPWFVLVVLVDFVCRYVFCGGAKIGDYGFGWLSISWTRVSYFGSEMRNSRSLMASWAIWDRLSVFLMMFLRAWYCSSLMEWLAPSMVRM